MAASSPQRASFTRTPNNWEYSTHLKLLEEDLGEGFPEVRGAEDGLDDNHSPVPWVDQEMPAGKWPWLSKGWFLLAHASILQMVHASTEISMSHYDDSSLTNWTVR